MLVVNGISCRETEWNIDQFYCCCCISGHTASAAPASPTPGCCGAAFSLRGGDGVRFRDDLGLPSGSTISVSLGRVNRRSARRTLCGALGRKRLRPWPQVGPLLLIDQTNWPEIEFCSGVSKILLQFFEKSIGVRTNIDTKNAQFF